jgi:hypothetical protein
MDFISSTWALPSKLLPSSLLELQLKKREERVDDVEDVLTVLPEDEPPEQCGGTTQLVVSVASTIFCVSLFAVWFLTKGYNNFTTTVVVASVGVALLVVNAIIGVQAAFEIANHKHRSATVKFSTAVARKPTVNMVMEDKQK